MKNAIETTGTVSANRSIILDESLPLKESSRVRVIVLLDQPHENGDLSEADWMRSASRNEVFEMLAGEEDIYSEADGKPL